MKTPSINHIGFLVVLLIVSSNHTSIGDELKRIDFVKQIQPILRAKCYECHGIDSQEAGLRLDYRKAALLGGDNGEVIITGKSGESPLFQSVVGEDKDKLMPPAVEGEPLTPKEVAVIRAWIDQGANWPDGVDGNAAEQRLGADHWAFQPLVRPEPQESNDPWVRNDIDTFVLRRLKNEAIQPSSEAEPYVLIRRLYLDLIGLPPTPEELDRWLTSEDENWYELLVDHLLNSPHFGER
ncbi:MAG: DUF1549 domain-containing protein [Planctomycetes bacterium]|nr:DUF1549 domain-containing protein [Planctomycetota bacterium]